MSVQSLTLVLQQLLPEPHAGLLAGILFGTKATLDPGLRSALTTSGTIHMIALSGQNISILVTILTPLLILFVSRRIASLLIILILVGYVAFVGVSPSVVRAAIMGSVNVFAVIVGRVSWSLFTWILAVSSMVVLHPLWITDAGFQLSAAASLGIILFGGTRSILTPIIWKKILLTIESELRVTLAAQSLTIPLILWYFHRVSLAAPLSNLAVGWTMPILMVTGWLTTFFGSIWSPLGLGFAWISWVLLEWMIRVVMLVDTIPFASIGW